MIYPQHSFFKLNDHIAIFNINTSDVEELKLIKLLEPIQELLESLPKNCIYLYKSGGLFHSEALLQVGEKYASANSVGCTLEDTISTLVPKLIESTSTTNLFPRNKQLPMGDSYEITTK